MACFASRCGLASHRVVGSLRIAFWACFASRCGLASHRVVGLLRIALWARFVSHFGLASHRWGGLLRIALVGCLKKLGGFGMIGGSFLFFWVVIYGKDI